MQGDLRDSSHKNGPAANCFLYSNAPHPVHRPQHRRHSQRPLRPPLHGLHRHDRRNPALRRRLRCRHDLHNDPVLDRHAASCVPEFINFFQQNAPFSQNNPVIGRKEHFILQLLFNHCHLTPLRHTAIAKIIAQAYLNISDT